MAEKAPVKLDWDPWKLMNVTKEELQAAAERKKMKAELKAKWQRMSTNPHVSGRGGHQLDPAVQRWVSARATAGEHFKVTSKTIPPFLYIVVIPVTLLSWLVIKQKQELNRKIRAGEITARDRMFKFHF